jgi:hypothetical protein
MEAKEGALEVDQVPRNAREIRRRKRRMRNKGATHKTETIGKRSKSKPTCLSYSTLAREMRASKGGGGSKQHHPLKS